MKHFRLFLVILISAILIVLGSFYFGLEGLVKINEKFREFRESAFSSQQEPIRVESSSLRGVNKAQTDKSVTQNYRSVYFQFTNNFNFKTQMHYVGSHIWQVAIRVPESDETFVLVAEADSSVTFGDEDLDGKVDIDGPDIPIQVSGLYVVRFDERTLDYTVTWRGEDVLDKTVKQFAKNNEKNNEDRGREPVARAGEDIQIELGQAAYFDGSASTDPDDDIDKFIWSNGLRGELATKVYSEIGDFPVVLTVVDALGNQSQDELVVTVLPRRNGLNIGHEWVKLVTTSSAGLKEFNLDVTGDHFWSGTVDISQDSNVTFQTGNSNPITLGDSDANGIADIGGLPIKVEHGGFYFVQLDDESLKYSIFASGNNLAPRADAGSDQTTSVGELITLDASASEDADGYIVAYEWSTGDEGETVQTTFEEAGTYEIRLTVTDDKGLSSADSLVVVVNESNIESTLGAMQLLPVGGNPQRMTLIADFQWSLDWTASGSSFWFLAPKQGSRFGDSDLNNIADEDGRPIDVKTGVRYEVRFNEQTNEYGISQKTPDNTPPVAVLGDDKTVRPGESVILDGSQSYDEDGYVKSFEWDDGQQLSIVTISFNEPGIVEKTLTVTDDRGATDTATMRIFVEGTDDNTAANQFQVAVSSDNWQPQDMQLTGTVWKTNVSFTGAGDEFMFISDNGQVKWGDTSGDGVADRYAPMIPAPDVGFYTLTIDAESKRYRIENQNDGVKPSANAGADQTAYVGDWVQFDATASIPSTGGQIVKYQWSHGGVGATPSIQYDQPGTYEEVLTIHDSVGKTSADTVKINVLAASQYGSQYKTMSVEIFPENRSAKYSVAMLLTAPNIWQAEIDVNANTGQLLEIRAVGDAEYYLGKSDIPATLGITGEPISVDQPGRYLLEIYDLNLTYSLQYLGEGSTRRYNRIIVDVLAPNAQPIEMKLVDNHLWQAEIQVSTEWQSPSFTLKTQQGQLLGDSNVDGLLDQNGRAIALTSPGLWVLDVDDETNAYLLTQESFASKFAQLFLRVGSESGLPIPMELIADNTWSTVASFDISNDSFIFDVFGDGTLTYGDNDGDRVADEAGSLIYVNEAGTQYEIRFYDNTQRYVIFERPN